MDTACQATWVWLKRSPVGGVCACESVSLPSQRRIFLGGLL